MEELMKKVIEGMKIQKDRFGRINFDSAFNWAARQVGLSEESYPSRKRAVKKLSKKAGS